MRIRLRYYLLLPAIWTGITAVAQTSGQNYIVTTVPFQAVSDPTSLNDNATDDNANTTIEYFDGLGRLLETVQKDITPQGADLVTGVMYDAFGRDSLHWLPAVEQGNNGSYVGTYAAQASSYNGNDANPYSRTDYEASPLNRVTGQYGPGADWYTNGKKVTTAYLTNGASEVKLFTVTGNTLNGNGYYAAGTLYAVQTTDEDGKTVEVFTDKQGRKVLSRVDGGTDTYYVYDDLNNLRYVLPPVAADSLSANSSYNESNGTLGRFGYIYHYDNRNRCVMKKLPGCDSICMVYDMADRLILSQDGNQRINKQWTVNKYDVFGRLLYSGLLTNSNTRVQMANTYSGSVVTETYTGSGPECGYTCSNLTPYRLLVVNYYDNYACLKLPDAATQGQLVPVNQSGYTYPDTLHVKSLLTGTRIYHLDNPAKYEVTAIYYDKYGRTVQTRATNHMGGYDMVYNLVDFTGKPTQTMKTHGINGTTASISEVYTYTYDKAQRLLTTTHQLNGGAKVILASNSYDELGRLQQQILQNGLNTANYSYNVRSWLKSINGNRFSETLLYNENLDADNAYYNGNVASMSWKVGSEAYIRKYQFDYDGLNRLTYSRYWEKNNNGVPQQVDLFTEFYTYDKQGNLLTLFRNSNSNAITDPDRTNSSTINGLYYTYYGNQIKKIYDDWGSPSENYGSQAFIDGASLDTEYLYDKNGNQTVDYNKGIAKTQYNVLNLPDTIQMEAGHTTEETYNASGVKLRIQYITAKEGVIIPMGTIVPLSGPQITSTLTTDYCGNYVYENDTLKRILTPTGYIEGGIYYTYLKDHLGNNRMVIDSSGKAIEIVHYYPSGVAMSESTLSTQPYRFGGKEFDEMHGLNWYDFQARPYDAAFERFVTVDPRTEKHPEISPYVYCSDNPTNKIDPDGKDDYFTTQGNYLGTDNDPNSNNIRIIPVANFKTLTNMLEKNEYSAVASSLQDNSVSNVFSQANMTDKASLSVYSHYNTTGLPLAVNNKLGETTMMQTTNSTAPGESKVEINVQGNKNDSRHLMDNVNNVENTFAHEKKHRTDFVANPQKAVSRSDAQNELRAIDAQRKDPSYKGTTDAYKDAVNRYELFQKKQENNR